MDPSMAQVKVGFWVDCLDLADDRRFVAGFEVMDGAAHTAGAALGSQLRHTGSRIVSAALCRSAGGGVPCRAGAVPAASGIVAGAATR